MKNLFLLLFISLNLFPCVESAESDSGIRGKPYKEIINDLKKLESQTKAPVKLIKYGETIKRTPLYVVKIGKAQKKSPAVIISGATHGNEYLNIADRLPAWFANNTKEIKNFFDKKGVIYIVPIFNPDGYDKRMRENSARQDLNRDFSLESKKQFRFVHNETKTWKEFLEKEISKYELDLKVSMDYHCCYGALLFPWAYTTRIPLKPAAQKKHDAMGELMKKEINSKYIYGSTGEILWYTPKGTSKDYYYDKFNAISATFEGEYNVEDQNFSKHTKWWSEILNNL